MRQKFTGQERDSESGLDYFLARDYQSGHGRFTSVDPLLASASLSNPQTFNRYSYVLNNPLRFTDPLGLSVQSDGGPTGGQDQEEAKKKQQQEEDAELDKIFIDRELVVVVTSNLSEVGVAPSSDDNWGNVATTISQPDASNGTPQNWTGNESNRIKTGRGFAFLDAYVPTPDTAPYGGGGKSRTSDFRTLNTSFGRIISANFSITRDNYGNTYVGLGLSVGLGLFPVGGSLVTGEAYKSNGDRAFLEDDVKRVLTGFSNTYSFGAGLVFTGSWNSSWWNAAPTGGSTVAAGVGDPQISFGKEFTFILAP